jgi:hypothetical protein
MTGAPKPLSQGVVVEGATQMGAMRGERFGPIPFSYEKDPFLGMDGSILIRTVKCNDLCGLFPEADKTKDGIGENSCRQDRQKSYNTFSQKIPSHQNRSSQCQKSSLSSHFLSPEKNTLWPTLRIEGKEDIPMKGSLSRKMDSVKRLKPILTLCQYSGAPFRFAIPEKIIYYARSHAPDEVHSFAARNIGTIGIS